MSNNYSRRDVLRGGVAATVGLGLGLTEAAQAQKPMEPGQKLRVGIIGCGGKGWSGREQAVAAGTFEAARQVADANGFAVRVSSLDGEPLLNTADWRMDRINVELVGGRVASCTFG